MSTIVVVADQTVVPAQTAAYADLVIFLQAPTRLQTRGLDHCVAIQAINGSGTMHIRDLHMNLVRAGALTFTGFHGSSNPQDIGKPGFVDFEQAKKELLMLPPADFAVCPVPPQRSGYKQLFSLGYTVICPGEQTTIDRKLWQVNQIAVFSDVGGSWNVQQPARNTALYTSPFGGDQPQEVQADEVTIGADLTVTTEFSRGRRRKPRVNQVRRP